MANGDDGKTVQHVGFAGDADVEASQLFAVKYSVKGRVSACVIAKVFRTHIIVFRKAVGQAIAPACEANPTRAFIVAPGDAPAVLGQQLGVLVEGLFNVINITEEIQVIFIDIGDDGHRGAEVQKAVIKLTGFNDKIIALAAAGASTDEIQFAADMYGRIHTGGYKALRQHGGGGGFAVGTAYADGKAASRHQLADQITAFNLLNTQPCGLGALRVFHGNGGGVYDHIRAMHIFGGMTDVDFNALFLQMFCFMGAGFV